MMKGNAIMFGSSEKAAALKKELLARGWRFEDGAIDMIVIVPDTADYACPDRIEGFSHWDSLTNAYREIAGGFLASFSSAYPRLVPGGRICMVTELRGSTTTCQDTDDYGVHMALAANNMSMMALFNQLSPKGYTFRAYAGDNMRFCAEYLERDRSLDGDNVKHSDEKKLTLRTDHGVDLSW